MFGDLASSVTTMDLIQLATDSKYVSITTFRSDGTPRSTPVWIADLGDGTAGFTTGLDSYKVKRIGNDPAVELRQSDVRGNVADDATTVEGTARVVTGDEVSRVRVAIKAKYGLMFAVIVGWEKVKGLFRRGSSNDETCGVVVSARS